MAVFTEVPHHDAAALIGHLGIGELTALKGIASGIENTNYFADTTKGRYVLTLFERLSHEQLPFYLHLMKHLAQHGVPVPDPQADETGEILHTLCGKPAAVVNRLEGSHQLAPDISHCESVGAMLARMHLAGADYPRHQPNLRGLAWWAETIPVVLPHLTPEQRTLIESELAYQQQVAASAAYEALPKGPIHADLFRDNVMFVGHQLTGFFDFYFAGVDTFLFDVAVCLNDWCTDLESGRLVEERALAFVGAYDAVRPLNSSERRLMPALLRAAALRFWVSRLWDFHLPRDASMLKPHDPTHFERVLSHRVAEPWHPAIA
ncbi:homoserine kinase [Piscinibacter gummiphilus]|uniref:Homoserine kinase n=1 Tax=Piscinibacter gummiphilus TaxID=946333 RepID=A0ABZ0CXT6_9BURK|nr:homoserine kinase [Piscinibacter gummiphilus]WOB09767.1 homoserine kinase [Piscinibacter gummiphilus]